MSHKKILKIIIMVIAGFVLSQAGTLTLLHGTKGQADKALKTLEKRFPGEGFTTAAKNEHLETHYYNQFKDKNLDLLNFYRIYNKEGMRELLIKNPDFGAFTPFNFLAFKKLDSMEGGDTTWYGHLDSDTMLDIIGARDNADREMFKAMLAKLDALVLDEMKPKLEKKLTFDAPLPFRPLLKMVKKIDDTDDIEDYVESFIMEHDSLFTKHNFVIAGFLDVKFEYEDSDLDFDAYDAYWVSSLCHFKFSNAVFNHGEPQAGVFAPCSIYFYIPKGSDELHVGYAKVDNWITTTGIKDEAQLLYMKKVADEVQQVFEELGFKLDDAEHSGMVSPEKATQDGDIAGELSEIKKMILGLSQEVKGLKMEIKNFQKSDEQKGESLSAKLPPAKKFTGKKMVIGGEVPEELTAYYAANPQTVESLVKKLRGNGFDVLATTDILDGKQVVTVTNEQLKETNTFLAVLNILVNGTEEIRVQNPSYFGAAYLGDKYRYGQFSETLKALQNVLGDMYETEERMPFSKLKDFTFQPGMAHYSDFIEVEEGSRLGDKLRGEKASKYIDFTLKLPNGNILVGHKMRSRVNKFLNKIGEEKNAQLLPYLSLVKKDMVIMMDPTYYLALSLPSLSMEAFMKIATTPDEIGKGVGRLYR